MYRRLLWLAVACVFIFLVGCDTKKTVEINETTNNPSIQTEEENNEETPIEQPNSDPSPGNNENEQDKTDIAATEIQKATEQDGERTIHYPQLVMQDASEERKINDLIYSEVTAYASQYDGGTLIVDFQIMWHTDYTLSILYNSEFNGGMYPTELIFTTNINLRNGEKIGLSDVVEINENFVEKLKGSPYLDPENSTSPNEEKKAAVLDYLNSIEVSQLVDALKQGDQTNSDSNQYNVYSYLQDETVVASIEIPHAIGDHAEFRVRLD